MKKTKRKLKKYLVSYEIHEHGEEIVEAYTKKEAIQKVQDSPRTDGCSTNFEAEECDHDEETTIH